MRKKTTVFVAAAVAAVAAGIAIPALATHSVRAAAPATAAGIADARGLLTDLPIAPSTR